MKKRIGIGTDDAAMASGRRGPSFRAGAALALLAALAPAAILASCGDQGLGKYFSYEGRIDRVSPPDTVEELKAAIREYSAEVEKTVDARRTVAIYQRMLANRYLQEQLYGPAYDAALAALGSWPSDPQLHYALAVSAAWLAKTAGVERGPADARRTELLGVAERAWKAMLGIDPRSTRAMYGYAVLLVFDLGRPREALPLLDSLVAIETRNVDALFLRGRVRYELGDLEGAANDYALIVKTSTVAERKAQAEANLRTVEEAIDGPAGRP